ncbi:hypothetical protein BH20ACT19_BH20ACT19_02370 [soil metagenome]
MRRLAALLALVVAIPVLAVVGTAAGGDPGGDYRVRAIFDNVASAVPGEDVKVAGAKVGVIEDMDVTADKKAAVTLRIEDARFSPFRADAKCTVRPQSLIGEKFVECEPGTADSPELERIEQGDGEGEHLLALERTSSPVDLDLVNNILRRPYRERLAILLGEFGTGLAGRGEDLNAAIARANPALRETDRVLRILSEQNEVLADLARDSDRALAPLARERERVSDFVVQANETGQATAERRADIERGIERLPAFLTELRPLMRDLGSFAGEATPVVRDLNAAGDDVSRLVEQLGPFSKGARASLLTLGDATVTGRPALLRTRPLIRDLAGFAADARPASRNLDELTASLDRTGGIERLMDLLFYSMLSINGFDSVSHYLRAALLVNTCTDYAVAPLAGCEGHFTPTEAIRSGSASSGSETPIADAVAAFRRGDLPDAPQPPAPPPSAVSSPPLQPLPNPATERERNLDGIRERAQGHSPALDGVSEPMLDYLLGSDAP